MKISYLVATLVAISVTSQAVQILPPGIECVGTCALTQHIDIFAPPEGACYDFSAGPFVSHSGTDFPITCQTCTSCSIYFFIHFDGSSNCPSPYTCLRVYGQSGGAPLDGEFPAKIDSRFGCTAPCGNSGEETWGAHPCPNSAAIDVLLFVSLECGC